LVVFNFSTDVGVDSTLTLDRYKCRTSNWFAWQVHFSTRSSCRTNGI